MQFDSTWLQMGASRAAAELIDSKAIADMGLYNKG